MTNEELKEKIAHIIADYCCPLRKEHKHWGNSRMCYSKENFAECEPITACTDALIEAGIGEVEEAEHRAEVAEKALKNAVDDYVGLECTCKGVYDSHFDKDEECEDCELRRFEMEDASPCAVNKYLNYAEKELAEEEEK